MDLKNIPGNDTCMYSGLYLYVIQFVSFVAAEMTLAMASRLASISLQSGDLHRQKPWFKATYIFHLGPYHGSLEKSWSGSQW